MMRDRRPRTARQPSRVASQLSALFLIALGAASACATEENTLDGDDGTAAVGNDDSAPTAGTPSGGKSPAGGASGSSGTPAGGTTSSGGAAGSGGKVSGAFGGTTSNGGSAGSGDGGAAGTSSGGKSGAGGTAGTTGSGGKGGTSGAAGTSSGGKSGAGGTAGTSGGGSGTTVECLKDWKSDACDTCTTQTQSDKLACVDILDCFAANACGPTTCANNDDKCGVNKIGKGTAGYPIATEVYDCLCK